MAAIRIVDQYGRQAPTGKRYVGSEIFDVTVGPLENEFTFVPDTVNIRVGDTVRWTLGERFSQCHQWHALHREWAILFA